MLPRRKFIRTLVFRFFFFVGGDSHVKVTGCPWTQYLEVGITDFGLTFGIQNGKLNFCP